MAGENVAYFLARREHELRSRLAALRGQMKPLETELAQVQQMRALLPEPDPKLLEDLAKLLASQTIAGQSETLASQAEVEARPNVISRILADLPDPTSIDLPPLSPWTGRTIKDLVIQALIDAFPQGGNATQIRNFIQNGYHREVDAGSLRTQLHRMKAAGILGRDDSTDTWNFADSKRALYQMYDHPTSRAGMSELQDEPRSAEEIESDEFLRAASALAWREEDDKK